MVNKDNSTVSYDPDGIKFNAGLLPVKYKFLNSPKYFRIPSDTTKTIYSKYVEKDLFPADIFHQMIKYIC